MEIEKTVSRAKKMPAAIPKKPMQNHDLHLKRLARIKGQVEGIERMMQEGRYCTDILQQIKSVGSAVKGLECSVLEGHLRGCVRKAFDAKNPFEAEEKINELIELIRNR